MLKELPTATKPLKEKALQEQNDYYYVFFWGTSKDGRGQGLLLSYPFSLPGDSGKKPSWKVIPLFTLPLCWRVSRRKPWLWKEKRG
jgi:hypothetical protein